MAKHISKRAIILWGVPLAFVAVMLVLMFGRPLFRGATSFGFPNANKVRHISLADGVQHVELSKRQGRWMLGSEPAQQDMVVDALYALQMLQVKYPLSAELQQTYAEALRGRGLRVTISGWLGSLRGYTLYHIDTLLVGVVRSGKPYVLEVQGNEGLQLFDLLDANPLAWGKTLLVAYLPSQIAEVSVEDLGSPQRSFTLSLDTLGNAKLEELYSGQEFTQLNMENVKRYLSYFYDLGFERYATQLGKEEVEAVLLSNPAYLLTITSRAGEKQLIKLFYIPVGDELDAFGRPTSVDLNRCYLQLDDEPHLAIALWVDFDLLLKDFKFFLTE